jgi:hypothetical protein
MADTTMLVVDDEPQIRRVSGNQHSEMAIRKS